MLPGLSFSNIVNIADDFLGRADSEESLFQTFEDFLAMCKKANITLNPLKVRVGYEAKQFFGLKINKGKIESAERNLDPSKTWSTLKTVPNPGPSWGSSTNLHTF